MDTDKHFNKKLQSLENNNYMFLILHFFLLSVVLRPAQGSEEARRRRFRSSESRQVHGGRGGQMNELEVSAGTSAH